MQRRPSCARLVLSALVLAAASGCRSAKLPERIDAPALSVGLPAEELLRLGANDIVRARVHGHPELSTPESNLLTGTRIDPDGQLSLPLVGTVAVGGLTLPEARSAIRAAYTGFMKDPQVEVSVVEYAARRFYVYGEVESPGALPLDRPLNVYQALAFGGGFSPHANRKQIVLLRETPQGVDVHVIDGERPDASGLIAIQPNDFLFVRRTGVGKFSEEVLPVLSGISSTLSSITTLILIEDRLND
ncbi:MAG: polysaccharide biosynthesis/export family protein [Planctomycetota bacterium]